MLVNNFLSRASSFNNRKTNKIDNKTGKAFQQLSVLFKAKLSSMHVKKGRLQKYAFNAMLNHFV